MISIFKNASPFHTKCFASRLVLQKKIFRFAYVFFYFLFSHYEKRITSVFPVYPMALCDKLVSNWFNEEEGEIWKVNRWIDARTYRQQTVRKTYLSSQLRWNKKRQTFSMFVGTSKRTDNEWVCISNVQIHLIQKQKK